MLTNITYCGDLRTSAVHIASGETIITDAPIDNKGKGEAFSPTDLVATALGSCMLTIMAIKAKGHNIDLGLPKIKINKIMGSNPRRITKIEVEIIFDKRFSTNEKKLLQESAINCPVAKSIHPEIKQRVSFVYPN